MTNAETERGTRLGAREPRRSDEAIANLQLAIIAIGVVVAGLLLLRMFV